VSTLYLIRHGQASFRAADYDVLSQVGISQSRALGRYWAQRGLLIDALYTGPRVRHRDTATHLCTAAADCGVTIPQPTVMDELDEFPAITLITEHWPKLVTEDPDLASLMEATPAERRVDLALTIVTKHWFQGRLTATNLETYRAFVTRVVRGFTDIMNREGRSRNVAVVTSGGPVGVAIKEVWGLDDEVMFQVVRAVNNASVSEFRFRDGNDWNLIRFNTVPHLHDSAEITYR